MTANKLLKLAKRFEVKIANEFGLDDELSQGNAGLSMYDCRVSILIKGRSPEGALKTLQNTLTMRGFKHAPDHHAAGGKPEELCFELIKAIPFSEDNPNEIIASSNREGQRKRQ